MQCDNGKIGGAPRPSDGWHSVTIIDAKFGEIYSADKSKTFNNVVSVQFQVIESEEEGRKAFQSFFLDNKPARIDFAKLLYFSKAAPIVEKNHKIKDNLPIDKWVEKYLDVENPNCIKLINGSVGILTGRTMDICVKNQPDKERNTVRTNIVEYDFYGKAGISQKSESEPIEKNEKVDTEDEGW